MSTDDASGTAPTERVKRSRAEIASALEILKTRKDPVAAHLEAGKLSFESRILAVDPMRSLIVLEASADESANEALLARPRCSFFASPPGRHVEFAAADPERIMFAGTAAIQLAFPDVLVERQRRLEDRAAVEADTIVECLADDGGVLSFKGALLDVSAGGVGFLIYHPSITLEPGTVLKGCRIDSGDEPPLVMDLEVRYSELVSLANGSRAERSGCRILGDAEALKNLVEQQRGAG